MPSTPTWPRNYGTPATAYKGPNGDGTLDGRIVRDGTDAGGSIVPITILHHNDSHGNLAKGTFVGYTQLATLIKQERLHNPTRTLLLSGGDNIQGDAMIVLLQVRPPGLRRRRHAARRRPSRSQPLIAAFNAMDYDAMTLGNHEFNFGSDDLQGRPRPGDLPDPRRQRHRHRRLRPARTVERQAVRREDRRSRGHQGRDPGHHATTASPTTSCPSNIPGPDLQRPDRQGPGARRPTLRPDERRRHRPDAHRLHREPDERRGRRATSTPTWRKTVTGIDAIIGVPQPHQPGHRVRRLQVPADHRRRPGRHAGRHQPGLPLQQHAGRDRPRHARQGRRRLRGRHPDRPLPRPSTTATAEDAAIKAIVDPYVAALAAYNDTVVGQTTAPIDTLQAFTAGDQRRQPAGRRLGLRARAKHGITVDFHLSGAMTNKQIADARHAGRPGHAQGLRHVHGDALRELARGAAA